MFIVVLLIFSSSLFSSDINSTFTMPLLIFAVHINLFDHAYIKFNFDSLNMTLLIRIRIWVRQKALFLLIQNAYHFAMHCLSHFNYTLKNNESLWWNWIWIEGNDLAPLRRITTDLSEFCWTYRLIFSKKRVIKVIWAVVVCSVHAIDVSVIFHGYV